MFTDLSYILSVSKEIEVMELEFRDMFPNFILMLKEFDELSSTS